jgi:hypothetical protein
MWHSKTHDIYSGGRDRNMANSERIENIDAQGVDPTVISLSNQQILPASRQIKTQHLGSDRARNRKIDTSCQSETQRSDQHPETIIPIKERNLRMLKNDLIMRNPLRLMGHDTDDILDRGEFGAVLARAGVGKTAFLVQLSLNSLLRSNNVLHISLEDPVNKVNVWYKEVFSRIAQQYKVNKMDQLWDSVLQHRFIMTFRVEGFTAPKLEERLTDLLEQKIFTPTMMLIDGLPFDDSARATLMELKTLANKYGIHVWFAVRTHRHEEPGQDGLPIQLAPVADLFEVAIQLVPTGKQVLIKAIMGGGSASGQTDLILDPSTMLITDQI